MKIFDRIERFVTKVIAQNRNQGPFAFIRAFLYVLSILYKAIVFCRSWAYQHGLLPQHNSKIPVISIGNFVAGGTGKTPLTIMLAEELSKKYTIATLSRGYKSPAGKASLPVCVSNGKGTILSAKDVGDEPCLIASRMPNLIVIAGKDRKKGSEMAAHMGAKAIILDDGLQHRRLARDLDIIVINAQNPFGGNHYLPRGFLRDSPASLRRADLVVINNYIDSEHDTNLRNAVKTFTNSPIVSTKVEIKQIRTTSGKVIEIKNKKVATFCAIGHPELFEKTVSELGAIIVSKCSFPDHYPIKYSDLNAFEKECLEKGVDLLLCTEKDFVKLKDIDQFSLPIAWLEMQLDIVNGKEEWEEFIQATHKIIDDDLEG